MGWIYPTNVALRRNGPPRRISDLKYVATDHCGSCGAGNGLPQRATWLKYAAVDRCGLRGACGSSLQRSPSPCGSSHRPVAVWWGKASLTNGRTGGGGGVTSLLVAGTVGTGEAGWMGRICPADASNGGKAPGDVSWIGRPCATRPACPLWGLGLPGDRHTWGHLADPWPGSGAFPMETWRTQGGLTLRSWIRRGKALLSGWTFQQPSCSQGVHRRRSATVIYIG